MEVDSHFIRVKVQKEEIKLVHENTNDQPINFLTKAIIAKIQLSVCFVQARHNIYIYIYTHNSLRAVLRN